MTADILDGEDFYNLMQIYRHSPLMPQEYVIKAFENVKTWIRTFVVASKLRNEE